MRRSSLLEFKLLLLLHVQVDTLRLAIGYISFLAELVASDRGDADTQRRQSHQQEPPRKVVVIGNRSEALMFLDRRLSIYYFAFINKIFVTS